MARTASWKNWLILLLVRLFSKPRLFIPCTASRILVVTTTALGDTLWATPGLRALRKSFGQAHIAVLTSNIGEQVLLHNPDLDELILLKQPFRLLWQLRKKKFDAALIFHASQRLVLPLCALASIPRIIGTKGVNKGLDTLLTDAIEPKTIHEIERRLEIVETLGAKRAGETLSFMLLDEEKVQIDFSGPLVAFHPGSKEPFRRWPPTHFAAVGSALQQRFGCKIYLTGTKEELPLLEKLQQLLPEAEIAANFPSIRSLAAFLNCMDLFVSNDTGPFHLACALNTPVVGIYASTDPRLCGPHHAPNATVLSRPLTCIPCLKRSCRDPFCFLQIGPQEIIERCLQILLSHNHSDLLHFRAKKRMQ